MSMTPYDPSSGPWADQAERGARNTTDAARSDRAAYAAEFRAERAQAEQDARDAAAGFDFWRDVVDDDDIVFGGAVYSSKEWTLDAEDGVRRLTEDELADRRDDQRIDDLRLEVAALADASERADQQAESSPANSPDAGPARQAAVQAEREYEAAYARYQLTLENLMEQRRLRIDAAIAREEEIEEQERLADLEDKADDLKDRADEARARADAVPWWRPLARERARQDADLATLEAEAAAGELQRARATSEPSGMSRHEDDPHYRRRVRELDERAQLARDAARKVSPWQPFARRRVQAIAESLTAHAAEERSWAEYPDFSGAEDPDNEFWRTSMGRERLAERAAEDQQIHSLDAAELEAARAFDVARLEAATTPRWRLGQRRQAQNAEWNALEHADGLRRQRSEAIAARQANDERALYDYATMPDATERERLDREDREQDDWQRRHNQIDEAQDPIMLLDEYRQFIDPISDPDELEL